MTVIRAAVGVAVVTDEQHIPAATAAYLRKLPGLLDNAWKLAGGHSQPDDAIWVAGQQAAQAEARGE